MEGIGRKRKGRWKLKAKEGKRMGGKWKEERRGMGKEEEKKREREERKRERREKRNEMIGDGRKREGSWKEVKGRKEE